MSSCAYVGLIQWNELFVCLSLTVVNQQTGHSSTTCTCNADLLSTVCTYTHSTLSVCIRTHIHSFGVCLVSSTGKGWASTLHCVCVLETDGIPTISSPLY